MLVPDVHQIALREACVAHLYGFDARYRRDDAFDDTLAEICAWAVSLDDYDEASIDVFTGDDVRTVSGRPQPGPTLAEISTVVHRHPRRRFHSRPALRSAGDDTRANDTAPSPQAWAGATLFTAHGVVLGSVNVWSAGPRAHGEAVHVRLPLLARAAMQVLDQRQRILARRAVPVPGPRPVVDRRADTPRPSAGGS